VKTETYDTVNLEDELDWFGGNLSALLLGPLYGMSAREFREWRDDFFRLAFYFHPRNSNYDGALNRLARMGVPLSPILFEEVLPRIKAMPQTINSNEECHEDAEILRRGTSTEKWEVIEKWELELSKHPEFRLACKMIRITFFETADGKRGYVVNRRVPGTPSFPEPKLPAGAHEIEGIVTNNYPRRDLYEKLQRALTPEETTWLARQIRRIGRGKHGGRIADEELQECALSLEQRIKKYAPRGRRCVREIGELLQAAFPDKFQPRDDMSKATSKLIRRAQKRMQGKKQAKKEGLA
jgi:hypothetical protein